MPNSGNDYFISELSVNKSFLNIYENVTEIKKMR